MVKSALSIMVAAFCVGGMACKSHPGSTANPAGNRPTNHEALDKLPMSSASCRELAGLIVGGEHFRRTDSVNAAIRLNAWQGWEPKQFNVKTDKPLRTLAFQCLYGELKKQQDLEGMRLILFYFGRSERLTSAVVGKADTWLKDADAHALDEQCDDIVRLGNRRKL